MTFLGKTAARIGLAALGAVLAALPASQAAAAPTCATNCCTDVLITVFNPMTDGTLYIGTDGPVSSLQCTLIGGGMHMTLPASSSDRLYSFLMTAYFQKARVLLRVAENSTGCTILYAY